MRAVARLSKKKKKKAIPNQICLHLLGVPSLHSQQERYGDATLSSALSWPGVLAGASGHSAGEGALEGGCFLYSDTLKVYPPVFDVFGEGGL